jgi:unsaturated rhamnogalacturonyl hydrolase
MSYSLPRRSFVKNTLLAGAALGAASLASAASNEDKKAADPADLLVQKVKLAMLAMQRRAWEQGVASQALLELGEHELVILMAKDAVVNQLKDGRLGLNEGNSAVCDPASNGEPLLFAAKETGDSALQKALDRMYEFALYKAPRTRDGIIYHNQIENQVWVDAIYMMPPFLAVMGNTEEAITQIVGCRRRLQDKSSKLYSHIWDEDRQSFPRKALWGVGNGWAAAGIARVIRCLPSGKSKSKDMLVGYAKEILDGALAFQRKDFLFHDVLNDTSTFVDTNVAQMLCYTIYRGVAQGWLDRSYLAKAEPTRAAIHAKVDRFGLVQGVCGAPQFHSAGTATEGQAFFLLMEAAYRDLQKASSKS